jgi:hypothetical protein
MRAAQTFAATLEGPHIVNTITRALRDRFPERGD